MLCRLLQSCNEVSRKSADTSRCLCRSLIDACSSLPVCEFWQLLVAWSVILLPTFFLSCLILLLLSILSGI